MENVIALRKIDRSVIVLSPPPLYFVFDNVHTVHTKKSRDELARPVNGNNFSSFI